MHSLYLMAAAFLTINVSCPSISVNLSISVTNQSIATNKTQSANMTILTSSTRSIPPSSLVPVNMTLTSSRRQTQIPTSSPVPVTSIMTTSRRQTQIPTSSPVPVTSTMTSSTRPITTSSSVPVIITVISSPSSTVTPVMPTTIAPSFPAVLRCYTMQITLSYNISKDLSISSLNPSFLKYTFILTTTNFMDLLNSCKNVEFTIKSTQLSRVDNSTAVELRIMLKFSAKSQIPDNDVEERLTKCLGELQESRYIGLLKNASLALTILGHQWYDEQSIQIHPSASCCGIGIKLPCCPASSIRWSSSCVPLYFADFIQNKQVRLGDTVQASCAVTTRAKVKIAWKRNKTILLSSVNGFNSTLIINNVGTSDAGVYHCQVKNDFQIITKPFYLKIVVYQDVEMKLTLVEAFHPDLLNSTSARYKTFRHFFIEQMGGALRKTFKHLDKIEVQSFSEGSVIVDFKVYLKKIFTTPTSSPPDLEGEVISAMLNLENFGNLSANSLVFKVKPPPPINIQIVGRGTSYIVLSWQPPQGWQSFQITDYIVRYTVVNRLDWKAIKVTVDKSNLKVPSLKTNTKYQIQMVSRSKLGDGKTSDLLSATTLTVNPIIINDGQTFTATVGQVVVLVCQGSSDPRPEKVTWIRKAPSAVFYTNVTGNGKMLNSYMVIHNVSVDDSGSYNCTASYKDVSKHGSVNLVVKVPVAVNMNITLTKMNFTEGLRNKSSKQFQQLASHFTSTLSLLYKNQTGFQGIEVLGFWKGSVKVSFRVKFEVKIEEPKEKNKQSAAKANVTNLIIRQVQSTDGQLGGGLTVEKDSLQTDAPPNPPRNVTVSNIKETSAHLAWIKPKYAEIFSVTHYVIKLKKHGHQFTWDEKVTTSYVQLGSRLEDLQENTAYNVKVLAKSGGKDGLESLQEEFQTDSTISSGSLLWLWILIPIVVLGVLGILLWCRCRERNRNDDKKNEIIGNKCESDVPQMFKSDIQLNSYKSLGFYNDLPEFSTFGIMPGKCLEIFRESITLENVLGSGAFGLVHKAQLNTGDKTVPCAVKMLKKMASDEEQRDFVQELEIMSSVGNHSNLLNLIGACFNDGPLWIVIEFAEKGSLIDYLRQNVAEMNGKKVCSLNDEVKLKIGLDIAQGMKHLANVKCVHRDLAARNVLLTESGQAKISDFGLSRDVYERGFYEKKSKGKLPVRWMAPEAIQQMLFTTQSDVWSYGVVLWEIETGGCMPYGEVNNLEIVNLLTNGYKLERPGSCKEDVYDIMVRCWQNNPRERPSFDQLCSNMEELLLSSRS